MEIKDVTRCAFMAPDPELMTVDFSQINKVAKEQREKRDAANPAFAGVHPDKTPLMELQRLRRELFGLDQGAKNTEIYTNNIAGTVKQLEERIAHTITQKKTAVASGNERSARNYEHAITQAERELAETGKEFQRARGVSAEAARLLKEWPHRERIKELETSLGA